MPDSFYIRTRWLERSGYYFLCVLTFRMFELRLKFWITLRLKADHQFSSRCRVAPILNFGSPVLVGCIFFHIDDDDNGGIFCDFTKICTSSWVSTSMVIGDIPRTSTINFLSSLLSFPICVDVFDIFYFILNISSIQSLNFTIK